MKKKENVYLTAIEDVYLLRIQVTEESGVKCFFEVTISKEIDKMSHDIRRTFYCNYITISK